MIPIVLPLALAAAAHFAPALHAVPASFRNDRIFVEARAPDGSPLEFYTDSGGGWNAIAASAAKRLSLPVVGQAHDDDGGELPLVDFPGFLAKQGVPRPLPESWLHGGLVVVPDDEVEAQGLLGNRWFAGHVWRIDYAAHRLQLLDRYLPEPHDGRAALGFRTKADGQRAMNFPRVTVSVDGEAIDMLLDTGATAKLTAAAAAKLSLPEGSRIGTSFITRTRFEAWQHKHPDWPLIEGGDGLMGRPFPMIEVPQVAIGGIASGPVWFTEKPDESFTSFMSQMTDRPVDGSIGGSALRYYRVVIDYPAATAWFQPIGLRRQ